MAPIPVRLARKAWRCLPTLRQPPATLPMKGPTMQLLLPPPEACPAPLLDREEA